MISQKERTVSELADPFDMSLAAISKHIKVLERANLVERDVTGRTHICSLNTKSLSQATEWLRFYEKFWSNRLDLLESELMKAKKKEHKQGCEMTFTQLIHVSHEENWTESDIKKALGEHYDGSEHGWNLMFMGLKELLETGKISYKG